MADTSTPSSGTPVNYLSTAESAITQGAESQGTQSGSLSWGSLGTAAKGILSIMPGGGQLLQEGNTITAGSGIVSDKALNLGLIILGVLLIIFGIIVTIWQSDTTKTIVENVKDTAVTAAAAA